MVLFPILAGGYDNFIARYVFDNDTLALTLAGKFPSGENPSWISANANRSVLLLYSSASSTTNFMLILQTAPLMKSQWAQSNPSQSIQTELFPVLLTL